MKIYFFGHGKVMENHCWKRVVTLATGSTTVLSGVASYGARASLDLQQFHFSSLWSKPESRLSKYYVVCEISWCRCQQLTALSTSTASVTKLIKPLLHPALKSAVGSHDIITIFVPPRNNSWRCHWLCGPELNGVSYVLRCASLSSNSTGTSLPVTSP